MNNSANKKSLVSIIVIFKADRYGKNGTAYFSALHRGELVETTWHKQYPNSTGKLISFNYSPQSFSNHFVTEK